MVEFFGITQTGHAILTLIVVGIMFVLFLRETYPTEVVAMAGVSLLLASGVLPVSYTHLTLPTIYSV